MTRDEILKTINEQYAELVAALEGIPEDALSRRPVVEWWTVKDLVGHIVMWQQVALKFIGEYKQDGRPRMLGLKDDDALDRYNKRGVVLRRDESFARVRQELDTTQHALVAAIESLSEADLSAPLPAPWGEGATLERLIAVNAHQHAPEHIEQIAAFKSQLVSR